jgi:SAM-dependent methyltransferase
VHLQLIERWVGPAIGRWLKTDLNEERNPERALIPVLEGNWVGVDIAAGRDLVIEASSVVCGDVRCLPFGTSVFDGVLSTSTLDHFDNDADLRRSVTELHRVLRPGGLLLLTMDNRRNAAIRARNAMPRLADKLTGQLPYPAGKSVTDIEGTALLSECGFGIVDVAHILHAPFILGTRPARWRWWEQHALPFFDRLGRHRFGRYTGHYVAFKAVAL